VLRALTSKLREFCVSRRGSVAIIYAVALIPLMLAVCGGLDYARAVMVRTAMTQALDAAALALGATKNLSDADAQKLANEYFKANYNVSSDFGTPGGSNGAFVVNVVRSGQSIVLSISDQMPTTVLRIVGFDTWAVNASTTVVWGQLKLWVSLVLDNTGSMTQTDSSGVSKLSALQTASHQLLTMLQGAVSVDGDVKVAIIPFTRNVNIGTATPYPTWLTFSDFTAAPATPSTSYGPGISCPWNTTTNGYQCTSGPANGSSTTSRIPSSGTYKGYICPSVTGTGHYWNGCFNSVLVSGTTNQWNHTWIPNSTSTWNGCVTDRGTASGPVTAAYDVENTPPTVTIPTSLMVAENSPSCVGTTLLPLTSVWSDLSAKIDQMVAGGSTNQTIGLVWGWHALSQGAPLSPGALPDNTQRIIILLSDGLNTQNRWYGNGSSQSTAVDGRMAQACTNAKADGVIIYAVYVDLAGTQGNSTVLQNCATDTSKYFDLTSSNQIITAFNTIGQQITNLRVSQ